jgi:choline kinase
LLTCGIDAAEKEKDVESVSEKAKELESATSSMRAEADAEKKDESTNDEPQEDEEFDYLSYANERALFAWGDAIRLGIVAKEDLPESLYERIKYVEY